jgi:valyl-tRNA synthetase
VIIEDCKKEIVDNTPNKISAQNLLLILLREQIISLHPFMPFVTEEIWKEIKNEDDDLLLVTKWAA